jgi:hypothetical protein
MLGLPLMPPMQDIKRRYPIIMDLYSGSGHLIKHLDQDITQKCIMVDSSEPTLYRDKDIDYEGLPIARIGFLFDAPTSTNRANLTEGARGVAF